MSLFVVGGVCHASVDGKKSDSNKMWVYSIYMDTYSLKKKEKKLDTKGKGVNRTIAPDAPCFTVILFIIITIRGIFYTMMMYDDAV